MLKFRVVLLPILAVAIVLTAAMPVNSATGPTTGTRNVAVILMNQPNTCNKSHRKCPHPWPKGAATRDMGFRPYQNHHSSVDEWFRLASGGQLRITGRVFGPWNTDGSMAYTNTATGQGNRRACNLNNWLAAVARAAGRHRKAHFNIHNFDSIIIYAPQVTDQLGIKFCGFDGVASVKGSLIFLNGNKKLATIVHELGHNMGLDHAGVYPCKQEAGTGTVYDKCLRTYGDPNDAMGCFCARYFNAIHKFFLHWISNSNIQTVSKGGGTFEIVPSENPVRSDNKAELIFVPRDADSNYAVEFRHSNGYDRGSDVSGVWIRITEKMHGTWRGVYPGPNDTELFRARSYKAGETFHGIKGKVTIKVVSVRSSGATLNICVDGCTTAVTGDQAPTTRTQPKSPPATDPPSGK